MQIHFFNNENLKETEDFQDMQIVGLERATTMRPYFSTTVESCQEAQLRRLESRVRGRSRSLVYP